MPIEPACLREYFLSRNEFDEATKAAFIQQCGRIDSILNERSGAYHTEFSRLYSPIDPDSDHRDPQRNTRASSEQPNQAHLNISATIELCGRMLVEAGYQKLEQKDIEACVGVASQWGVPLHVDFELFRELHVFARGDIIGTRFRRRFRTWYQREPVDVPVYQRMVILFQLTEDDNSEEQLSAEALHLRMFKNIPKLDVDMLLPCTKVRISKVDRMKIIVPSLGGLLMSLRRIAQFLFLFAAMTLYSSMIFAGLVFAALGYIVRSVISYFQTKNRYLLNLAKNLYFQKLDTNAGVGYCLIQQARQQSEAEATLALFGLFSSGGKPMSCRKLRRRCERVIREAIGVEIDFQVDRALFVLHNADLIERSGEDSWQVKSDQSTH